MLNTIFAMGATPASLVDSLPIVKENGKEIHAITDAEGTEVFVSKRYWDILRSNPTEEEMKKLKVLILPNFRPELILPKFKRYQEEPEKFKIRRDFGRWMNRIDTTIIEVTT